MQVVRETFEVVVPRAPQKISRLLLIGSMVAVAMGLVFVVAIVSGSGAGRQIQAQQVSWELKSSQSILRAEHAVLLKQAAARGALKPALKARFVSLGGIYSDLQYIAVSGTRFDDGCDRAATTGCKGVKMWVPKGAKYPGDPDEEKPGKLLKALAESNTDDPVLTDLDTPAADHDIEVNDILSTSNDSNPGDLEPGEVHGGGKTDDCDFGMDFALWLACEEAKHK